MKLSQSLYQFYNCYIKLSFSDAMICTAVILLSIFIYNFSDFTGPYSLCVHYALHSSSNYLTMLILASLPSCPSLDPRFWSPILYSCIHYSQSSVRYGFFAPTKTQRGRGFFFTNLTLVFFSFPGMEFDCITVYCNN